MFINIKGRIGKYNAVVTWFYKSNLDSLKKSVAFIYRNEYDAEVPEEFINIKTIKGLKDFINENMSDMDNYPYGFKYIDGTYALYECIG